MFNLKVIDPHFLPHCGCRVELNFDKGKLVSLIGENGLGKTTLVQRFYADLNEKSSIVEQKNLHFFYDRTLGQFKKLFLNVSEHKISHERFQTLWKRFNLSQKEDRYLSSLSGGEGQALKISLGLSVERDLYFLDEPSQYLDDSSRLKLADSLSELIRENKSIVLIEHDLTWVKIPMEVVELKILDCFLQKDRNWNT